MFYWKLNIVLTRHQSGEQAGVPRVGIKREVKNEIRKRGERKKGWAWAQKYFPTFNNSDKTQTVIDWWLGSADLKLMLTCVVLTLFDTLTPVISIIVTSNPVPRGWLVCFERTPRALQANTSAAAGTETWLMNEHNRTCSNLSAFVVSFCYICLLLLPTASCFCSLQTEILVLPDCT